jgi:hypothetical protein
MKMKTLHIQARVKRIKQEKIIKILKLLVILAVLTNLVLVQKLLWLKYNKPLHPEWFSQTVTYEVEFTFK